VISQFPPEADRGYPPERLNRSVGRGALHSQLVCLEVLSEG